MSILIFAFAAAVAAQPAGKTKSRMNIYIISKDKKLEFLPFPVKARAFVKVSSAKKECGL